MLFLVVRGTPAMLLYRGVLPLREDRQALALFTATQLPLVVAITTVAVDGGDMRSSTAAALIGAGALSTLAGPLHGLRMRRIARSEAGGRRGMSHHRAHHEVRPAGRVLRLRIWLSSAMWLPVLATNVVAIVRGARPAGHRRARRRARPAARALRRASRSSARSPAA